MPLIQSGQVLQKIFLLLRRNMMSHITHFATAILGSARNAKCHKKQRYLNDAQEAVLLEWIQFLGVTGHPVSKQTIRPKVHEMWEISFGAALGRSLNISVTDRDKSLNIVRRVGSAVQHFVYICL
jgi:hypothetical protein